MTICVGWSLESVRRGPKKFLPRALECHAYGTKVPSGGTKNFFGECLLSYMEGVTFPGFSRRFFFVTSKEKGENVMGEKKKVQCSEGALHFNIECMFD